MRRSELSDPADRDADDQDVVRLATESFAVDDATGWFDKLYVEAAAGSATVPWDAPDANALLIDWAGGRRHGGRAMVVGAGLGRDAEFVASLGYGTTAFDVSPAAADGARERYPDSAVTYATADLLDLPADWRGAFDLVVESYTVQSLPERLHPDSIDAVASLVAPGGTLLVIAAAGTDGAPVAGPPWPLTPSEIDRFGRGLDEVSREQSGPNQRWRVTWTRPV